MVFGPRHWEQLRRDGYAVVSGAVPASLLSAARNAADRLNAQFPEGWERSKNESWREIRYCRHPAFMTLVSQVLDPLALEILESAPPVDYVQLAATFPGFATKGRVGRNFHIDMGQQPALDVFNVLQGVALTDVEFGHGGQLPCPAGQPRAVRRAVPAAADGRCRCTGARSSSPARRSSCSSHMVVPHVKAGDIIVAHSFLAHGTSANTTDQRRDMFFQRRAAGPLKDPATQADARQAFMRNPWLYFRQ